MSSVKLQGAASGTGIFTIVSPNTNTDRTLTLPAAAATSLAGADLTQTLTNQTLGSGLVMDATVVTSATAVNTTSGTVLTLVTGLPSWIIRLSVVMYNVSLNGTSRPLIQFGTGSTPTWVTTGYVSGSDIYASTVGPVASYTGGFVCGNTSVAAYQWDLIYTFMRMSANTNLWVGSMRGAASGSTGLTSGGGYVTLDSPLTAIQLTSPALNTFDLGSVNVLYG